jgi:hypothetical protein
MHDYFPLQKDQQCAIFALSWVESQQKTTIKQNTQLKCLISKATISIANDDIVIALNDHTHDATKFATKSGIDHEKIFILNPFAIRKL